MWKTEHLAYPEDVERRLNRPLSESEKERANGLIAEASDLVVGYLGKVPQKDGTGTIAHVVSRMVARVFEQAQTGFPSGSEATTIAAGPYQQTLRFAPGSTSGQPWLTKTDREALRPYRRGVATIGFRSDQTGNYSTE